MITKICNKCSKELPADTGFYANDNACKECRKKAVRANRKRKIEYYRQYDRDRANRPDRVEARKEYAKTDKGIETANAAKKKWTQKNRKKRHVADLVNSAIRDGKIAKPESCQNCGKKNCRIEGHHDDYEKPFDVKWFCSACHREWHKKHGEGANGS